MADLYNLLADDNLLREEEDDIQEQEELQQQEGEEWDRDNREHVELATPPSPTTIAATTPKSILDLDDQPLELKDLQQEDNQELFSYYSKLKVLWAQEILSPELLPYDAETVTSVVDALADQENAVLEAASMNATGNSRLDSLIASVLKVDASRCRFLLCHLLRERLRKLEAFPWHTRLHCSDRMSENELEFLKEYGSLLETHLHKTVLDHFPQDVWKKLDAPEMIDEPDLTSYVFVRTKELVTIGNGTGENRHADEHEEGTCLIVRYSRVRELFLQDKVELLM